MVDLINFQIKNYKSIIDSKKCYLDGKITILAGKNEAGKTAILESLEDFNIDKNISDEAIPLSDEESKPEIDMEIKLDKEEINKIKEKFNTLNIKVKELVISIRKIYPNEYVFNENYSSIFVPNKNKVIKDITKKLKVLKEKITNLPIDENYVKDDNIIQNIQEFNPIVIEGSDEKQIKQAHKQCEELKSLVKELNKIKTFQKEFVEFFKQTFISNFILFKTFADILPNQIAISDAPNNELIKDLTTISNLDFEVIQPNVDPDKRKVHEEKVNLKFSKEYKKFWTQDHSNLYFWWDSTNIYFRIKEKGVLYKPEIRSKGRQWHLAFYIRTTARSLEGKKNIILIDEPGLFLHAKAQKDILRKLEECSGRNQVIYCTHSPYLIERDKLNRIRLVIKDSVGTKIEKLTAKADKETLTPILTAIGEDLSSGIKVDKINSVITEGYSDYLWLLSFKKLLNRNDELDLIPATGGDSPIYVGSILFGWRLDPIFILDNDKQGKTLKEKLKKKLSIREEKMLSVPMDSSGEIENLFSNRDYKKYADHENLGRSKVLLATQFYNGVEKEELTLSDLDEQTKNNFGKVLDKLKEMIENKN